MASVWTCSSSGLQGAGGGGVAQRQHVRQEEHRHGPADPHHPPGRPHRQLHHRGLRGLPVYRGREFLYQTPVSGVPRSRSRGHSAGHAIES